MAAVTPILADSYDVRAAMLCTERKVTIRMKKKKKQSYIASKLVKTQVVLRSPELAKHVPLTRPLTRSRLFRMLERYGMVYVKPDTGSQGNGVLRVEKRARAYRYRSGVRTLDFPTFQAMFRSVSKHTGRRRYVVQKGIHVLTYQGRLFDFRVMIQKNPAGKWECTGTAGRLAHPRKAVTNGSQGGTIFTASLLIKPSAGAAATTRLLRSMNRLAHLAAVQFSRAYPAVKELGVDIAIDRRLKPWILEVNTRPDPCPFTKLPNKRMIRRIVACARAYGRRYRLQCTKAKSAPARHR